MRHVRFVKLFSGEIIDLKEQPNKDCHYQIDETVLWVVPKHQASRDEYQMLVSKGRIIAKGMSKEEVDITVPEEFTRYQVWCAMMGQKAHEADTLKVYMNQIYAQDQIKFKKI